MGKWYPPTTPSSSVRPNRISVENDRSHRWLLGGEGDLKAELPELVHRTGLGPRPLPGGPVTRSWLMILPVVAQQMIDQAQDVVPDGYGRACLAAPRHQPPIAVRQARAARLLGARGAVRP